MMSAWMMGLALASNPTVGEGAAEPSPDQGAEATDPDVLEPVEGEANEEQEPLDEPLAVGVNDQIIVWGEGAVRHARDAIISDFEDLGYRLGRTRRDGTVVFRPPATWQGRVTLFEGLIDVKRPVVALWMPDAEAESSYDAARTLDGTDAPGQSGLRIVVLPSKRRLAHVERKVLEGTLQSVRRYREVVQRTASEDVLFALPGRLDALWTRGLRLDGVPEPLVGVASRRAHVLEFWASRADTPAGASVREAVEAWLLDTVQSSDTPLLDSEIATAEGLAGRALFADSRTTP